MQLKIDALKDAAAWPGHGQRALVPERAYVRGAAVPLMGPADDASATPLMGRATAGTITPLMGPAAPATVTPLLGPADRGTMVPLMGPADPGTATPLMLPKPVMLRADRGTDVSPAPAMRLEADLRSNPGRITCLHRRPDGVTL
jgi:hypothetical protein